MISNIRGRDEAPAKLVEIVLSPAHVAKAFKRSRGNYEPYFRNLPESLTLVRLLAALLRKLIGDEYHMRFSRHFNEWWRNG